MKPNPGKITPYAEFVPWISAHGLILVWSEGWFFPDLPTVNPRPGGQGDSDLWMFTRSERGGAWSQPGNLGPQVNTAVNEGFPKLTADGLEPWELFPTSAFADASQALGAGLLRGDASFMAVKEKTVRRHWSFAKTWLFQEIEPGVSNVRFRGWIARNG